MAATGLYPPIIVRTLGRSQKFPSHNGHVQIIDGHLRFEILKELGCRHAEVRSFGALTDKQTEMLLLTLNHLRSADDPQKRGKLLQKHLAGPEEEWKRVMKLLPDSKVTVRRLLDLASGRAGMIPQNKLPAMPRPFAVYLSEDQHALLARTLETIRKATGTRTKAEGVEWLARKYSER
jgi:ParB-like chromosome segregation protein Spo0J